MTKALVIGDIMLDVTVECEVARVSPEAPVIVGKEVGRGKHLGGAANVAANLKSLGVEEVHLRGVIGNDEAGEDIEMWCKEYGIEPLTEHRNGQRTTVKTRYVADGQLIFRHDSERHYLADKDYGNQRSQAAIDVADYDVVVFADYDKGVVNDYNIPNIITLCKVIHEIPVVVDCKPANLYTFKGATFITPNEAELAEMCHDWPDVDKMAAHLDIDWVVCTKGAQGLDVYSVALNKLRGHIEPPTRYFPSRARRVYDVTGAGDVITAAIAVCCPFLTLVEGDPRQQLFEFANTAAGLAVEQPGTTVVDRAAVLTAVAEDRLSSKILLKGAETVVENLQAVGSCVVFTNGCFDLLHPGHVYLLHAAKSEGDVLVVAVNSDESVQALKGDKRPVLPLHLRMSALASLDVVDYVVPFDEETPEALIRKLKPDVLVKGKHTGTDCPHQDDPVPGADYMASRGARVVFVDTIPGYSTTATLAGEAS